MIIDPLTQRYVKILYMSFAFVRERRREGQQTLPGKQFKVCKFRTVELIASRVRKTTASTAGSMARQCLDFKYTERTQ